VNAPAARLEYASVDGAEGDVPELEPLFAYLGLIDGLEGCDRRDALYEFARSPFLIPAAMLEQGLLGKISREAWAVLRAALDADTPEKAWGNASFAVGRESIARLLRVPDGARTYATLPFKTLDWQETGPRIAAAVGCPRIIDIEPDLWGWLDVADVLLWDPRSNTVEVAGEHGSATSLIMPDPASVDDRLIVYADPVSFFRAWAAKRVATFELLQKRGSGEWAHPIVEQADGGLPGALLIGDVAKAPWSAVHARTIVAGPGVDRNALSRAVLAAAHLPRIEEDHGDRG
jgi:hypothetical protein